MINQNDVLSSLQPLLYHKYVSTLSIKQSMEYLRVLVLLDSRQIQIKSIDYLFLETFQYYNKIYIKQYMYQ